MNSLWMKEVKRQIKEVKHVGFVFNETDNTHYIQVNLLKDGVKDKVSYALPSHPSKLRSVDWEYLITHVKNRTYETKADIQ